MNIYGLVVGIKYGMLALFKNILSKLNLTWLINERAPKKENRRRNGYWKEFNKQGILIQEGNYHEGLRIGKWKLYYDTGEIVIEESYVNGIMDGPYKSYDKNGQILSECQYKNNKRDGSFFVFNNECRLIKIMQFKDDVLIEEIIKDYEHSVND